jgi:phosphoribosylformylglycinamidine cyclo-ligase
VVAHDGVQRAVDALSAAGERAWILGEVIEVGDVPYDDRVRFEA